MPVRNKRWQFKLQVFSTLYFLSLTQFFLIVFVTINVHKKFFNRSNTPIEYLSLSLSPTHIALPDVINKNHLNIYTLGPKNSFFYITREKLRHSFSSFRQSHFFPVFFDSSKFISSRQTWHKHGKLVEKRNWEKMKICRLRENYAKNFLPENTLRIVIKI